MKASARMQIRRICGGICSIPLFLGTSVVQAQMQLNNPRGTSGAGSATLADKTATWGAQMQALLNIFLMGCAFVGVVIFVAALNARNKAAKEDREPPKIATIGLVTGPVLCIVPVVIGVVLNTIAA